MTSGDEQAELGQQAEILRHRLTLGGETRIRFERFVNPSFGSAPDDRSGYLLQRYLFHADLHVGAPLRVFAQVQSGLEVGRVGGPRPTDEDRLDLHQAFVDLQTQRGTRSLTLRVGRQEIELGSSRFVSAREGLNTRQTFDALRLLGQAGAWRTSMYIFRPVVTSQGFFDNGPDDSRCHDYLRDFHFEFSFYLQPPFFWLVASSELNPSSGSGR